MKSTLKAIFMIAILVLVAFGCETSEEFVTKEAGTWKVVNLNQRYFETGVLVSDITRTDSLGKLTFLMNGSGIRENYAAVKDTFIWNLNAADDRLVVYYPKGPWMNAAILEQTDNAMRLYWINEGSRDAILTKTESTARIERE